MDTSVIRVAFPLWAGSTSHKCQWRGALMWSAPKQAVLHIIETPVMWDAIALIITSLLRKKYHPYDNKVLFMQLSFLWPSIAYWLLDQYRFYLRGPFWIFLTVRWQVLMCTVGLVSYIRAAMHAVGTLRAKPTGDNGWIYHSVVLTHVPRLLSLGIGQWWDFYNTYIFSFYISLVLIPRA